jgi:hypothetical protein
MLISVSRRTLWVSLVILVIVVIIILLAVRSRSKYQYPDTTAAAKKAVTVSAVVAAGASYPGVVTLTVPSSPPHGLVSGDVILNGSTAYVVLSAPAVSPTSISVSAATTDVPVGTVLTPAYTSLSDALEKCNITQQNGGFPTADGKTFDTCVDDATQAYYSSMCPWTSVTATASMPTSVAAAYTVYQNQISSTLQTADANSVGKAYVGIKNAANTNMVAIANAARKADITGATRKYLSTVCPNYYVTATGTATPASYANWGVYNGAPPAGTPAAPAPTYYFDASRVKFATAAQKTAVSDKLKEWAKYAAQDPTHAPASATSLITGCTLFSDMSADGVTPNYKLAQQYGPGTVTTAVDLPWNRTENTCNQALTNFAAALN